MSFSLSNRCNNCVYRQPEHGIQRGHLLVQTASNTVIQCAGYMGEHRFLHENYWRDSARNVLAKPKQASNNKALCGNPAEIETV